jgi:cytochrome o ubiquinol oxidase subunit 1
MKQTGVTRPVGEYKDIVMPRNTPMGLFVAGFSFIAAFAIIWHIWWLAVIGLLGIIATLIIRSLDEHPEYVITAAELAHEEKLQKGRRA